MLWELTGLAVGSMPDTLEIAQNSWGGKVPCLQKVACVGLWILVSWWRGVIWQKELAWVPTLPLNGLKWLGERESLSYSLLSIWTDLVFWWLSTTSSSLSFPAMCIYIISPPQSGGYNDLSYRQGPLASEFPTELRSLLIYCKYPVYWFHKNCVHLLMQTDRVFMQWSVLVKWIQPALHCPRMRSFKGSNITSFQLSLNKMEALQHLVLTQCFLTKLKALTLQLQMSKMFQTVYSVPENIIIRGWKTVTEEQILIRI